MDSGQSTNHLDALLSKHKIPLAVTVVGLVLLIGGIAASGLLPKTFVKQTTYPKESLVSSASISTFKVDVSGAVASPGVYSLDVGARVEEAIATAGGLTAEANQEYVSKSLNLAQKVSDGMKVYIPGKGEKPAAQDSHLTGGKANEGTGVVNINSAAPEQLDKLPGVGPVTAQKIIDSRPYSSIEELFTKKVVTRPVYEKIKSLVSTY